MLDVAKPILQAQIMKALMDAYMKTYIYGAGDEGKMMAMQFAKTAAGPLADAICTFVKQATVSGMPVGLATPMGGPVTGSIAPIPGPVGVHLS